MKQVLIIGVLFATISGLQGFNYKDCGSKVGKFTKIEISGCDKSASACILRRNTNASIAIDFSLNADCSVVTTVVHGIILDVPVPFPLENPNACVDNNLACPLKKNSVYEYKAILPVEKKYPKISLTVRWELKDQNNNDILCIELPAKIA